MEQLSFDLNDFDSKEKDINSLANAREAFACCHRYRQCSNAGTCIVPDDPDAINCVYRLNLAKGRIFEGKNANGFDKLKYSEIENIYNNLPRFEKNELDSVLYWYSVFRSTFLWNNSNDLQSIAKLGFITIHSDKGILEKFTMKFLKSISKCNSRKKEELIEFMLNNEKEVVEKYINRFVYVSVPNNMSPYMFELYHDYTVHSSEAYKRKLPIENEDIFGKKGN